MVTVSVIVPCRNEGRFIRNCLDSIIANDYPKKLLEILVVDGASEDDTRNIIQAYQTAYPFIKLADNPRKIIPVAMNTGITMAKGKIIMKMDAHSTYEKRYISRCAHYLKTYHVDNVGGILITKPLNKTLKASAIALCLSHPFGVGSSPSRKKSASTKPRFVDTVAFGCYKREIFKRIGLYNENLVRSSDMEFNMRLTRAGGKILLAPDIVAYYYADGTFGAFWKHNISDGIWAIYPIKFTRTLLRPRHLLPLFFVFSLMLLLFLSIFSSLFAYLFIVLIGFYALASLFISLALAVSKKRFEYIFFMPLAFAIRHFGYGLGSVAGLLKIGF